jgi:hypothetical protein
MPRKPTRLGYLIDTPAYDQLKDVEREIDFRNEDVGSAPEERLEDRGPMTVKDKRSYSGDDPEAAVKKTYKK